MMIEELEVMERKILRKILGSIKDGEPVSYTHLDVYKRQSLLQISLFINNLTLHYYG